MIYEKSDIVEIIKETVYKVTQIKIDDENTSLLDTRLRIYPADFLYIFELLEKKLNVPAADILRTHPYSVMEIDKLSDALLELM